MGDSLPAKKFAGAATFALLVLASSAHATNIFGSISSTVTITEDSQLIGDVTCKVENAPCIKVGAPGITLNLNGFAITGRAAPPQGCTPGDKFSTALEDGIDVIAQHDVAILGPGLVQKFARQGIFLQGSTRVEVDGVTVADNCFSGIFLAGTADSEITNTVSVRNAIGTQGFACGGT